MKTKIEIKDIFGKVLFAYECEENTIKKTVEEAVRQNILLCGADLVGADLSGANLREARLANANLHGANLYIANLYGANLINANLTKANMFCTNLYYAKLCSADLCGACLRTANLYGANLDSADLLDTDLCGTNFYKANLPNIKNVNLPLVCPSDGAFTGWKKVDNYLIKLLIPEDAKRSSATTNKCRCDKAKVLEIVDLKTNEHIDEIINYNYVKCIYKVDEIVRPDSFDDNRWNECSNGIHFFINKCDAINYGKLF